MNKAQDKYFKLLRLARDQTDTPEGESAAAIAAKMLESDPTLGSGDRADVPDEQRSIRWSTTADKVCLLHCFAYFDVTAYSDRGSKAKLLYATADPALLVAIEEAYASTRGPLQEYVGLVTIAFLQGSMPLPPSGVRSDDPPSDDIVETVMSAMRSGRSHQPKKAIGDGSERP